MNKQDNKNKKAFTLVELIIVITILAILATIAFISFQGYSKNSRDGNRLTTLRNIKSGLEIYYTQTGNYPDTESGILIQSSGGLTTIGTQGYFGDTNSRLLKFSKLPIDPYDGNKYIYSINEQKNKYQIMGFLETSDYASVFRNTYADNIGRIPRTLGDNLGILLDTNNNPISGTGIDVENYTGNLKAIFSDNYSLEGSGAILINLNSTYKNGGLPWLAIDTNCDLPDVVIGGQVWAGCNSTLGYGAEWGQIDANIGTDNYSGTISSCNQYSSTSLSTTIDCPASLATMKSTVKETSWSRASGVLGTVDNIWGKFYAWGKLSENCKGGDFSGTSNNEKCACPNGWHIPTNDEWMILEKNLGCSDYANTSFRCASLGWLNNSSKSKSENLVKALNIPLSGRSLDGIDYSRRGFNVRIWSSSTLSSSPLYRGLTTNVDTVDYGNGSMVYATVRCIKD